MKRLLSLLLALSFIVSLPSLRAAGSKTHFDDPTSILPSEPKWTKGWDEKLDAVEHSHGIKIRVEFHPKSPSEAEDKKPGAYMQALSVKRGVARQGALVVYFADDDDWRVWISDDLTSTFARSKGTAEELTKSGAMHEAKEAFLKVAHDKGEAAFAAEKKAAPADHPPSPSQRVKCLTDALLSDLLEKLAATK